MLSRPTNHPDERMVFAEAKTIYRRSFPPRPLSRERDVPLEQFRDRRFHGDASPRDRAFDEGSRLPCGIGSSQRKPAEERVSVPRHSNRFDEPGRPDWIPRVRGIVAGPGEVIYSVLVRPDFRPNAHAEIPILRRPSRVHDLRAIAMPDDNGIVDWSAVRWSFTVTLGSENHMPHPHDWLYRVGSLSQ